MNGGDDEEAAKPLEELDDHDDREELRGRYEMFLQELRTILPGVQVLLAFLLTVPFSDHFSELDATGRRGYQISLLATMLSVIAFVSPSVFHRVAERTARKARLRFGLRMNALGLLCLAIALLSALWTVSRFVFGVRTSWLMTGVIGAVLMTIWVVIPVSKRSSR